MTTRALQKLVHVGCRELGIADEDERRDLYERITGKRSLRLMTESEQDGVVQELRRLGFRPSGGQRPRAKRADTRYAHVLWRLLSEVGAARVAGPAGLNAFVRARFERKWGSVPIDIDAMQDGAEIGDIIDALKDWCRREGIKVTR